MVGIESEGHRMNASIAAAPGKAALTAGVPDYSEVFVFGNSGKYRIRVTIELPGIKKPLSADFAWTLTI